jgi:hypothetical protein
VPWDHSSLTANFELNSGTVAVQALPSAVASPAPQAPAPDPALDAWNAVKDTESIPVLDSFIGRFGDSFYASLAKARLAELRKKEEKKVAVVTLPPAPAAPPRPVEPAALPQKQWTEIDAPERGFAILMPTIEEAQIEGKTPLVKYDYKLGLGDEVAYNVVVLEFLGGKAPKGSPKYYLLTGYANGSGAQLDRKGPVKIAGRDGYEATMQDGTTVHLVEVVARVYMLITAGPTEHVRSDDAKRFRGSFRIVGR